jgi:hypothetical protein
MNRALSGGMFTWLLEHIVAACFLGWPSRELRRLSVGLPPASGAASFRFSSLNSLVPPPGFRVLHFHACVAVLVRISDKNGVSISSLQTVRVLLMLRLCKASIIKIKEINHNNK